MTLPILFHQARAPDRHQAKRGLQIGPEIAVGDGALGFWKASRNPTTAMLGAHTVNILDKVPLSVQAANRGIRAKSIWRRIGRPTQRQSTSLRTIPRQMRTGRRMIAAIVSP
ncbi:MULTISPECIES: hypothetical protein [unclassified Bradyrhizobium]|uniref:hypothetical protein n=1 Tax=unclassified Bradyrhizobium TaxID=2631580 RepID=UPI001CD80A2F|nr:MULTISPECIES: hypothetical protein [unclassified Bradyrhizobium]MCA1374403.1 hypothetical protein [Bradyrhizobium sp. IC4060]MCA1484626.1 hypothetical protein [Bradyrhizobium sp. IC4061]